MTSRTIYPITSIGGPLAEILPLSGRWGTVFAVFRRSCYLESGRGQVFCLADQGLGEGPLTLGVELPADTALSSLGVSEGCHLETDGVDLRLGRALALGTAAASIWEPEPLGQTAPPGEILRRLNSLINLMRPLTPPNGLAAIVPHTAALANGESPGPDSMNTAVGLAIPRLCRLSQGLTHWVLELVDQAVAGLVGLGPGLTPSGDDLLGGMLVALRAMPDTAFQPSVDALAGCITRHASAKTTRISSAMLEQSARGYGSAAQHRLLRGLLGVDPRPDMAGAALDLIRTGHTSGWDALAGISLGVRLGLQMKQAQEPSVSGRQDNFADRHGTAGVLA